MENLSLMIALLLTLGIGAQWLSWFLKKPAIIFLLLIGLLLGPTFHLLNPDKLLGDLLFPFISLGVAIILFEGALTLEFQDIKNHGRVVTNLISIGVIITIFISALAAHFIMGLSYQISLLFGALVCVTGPTVITPLLRSVRPNKTISNILRWEGVIIDPIGALLVILIYEWIIAGHSPLIFAKTIIIGLALGFIGAFILATLFKNHWVPEYLQNVFTLSSVLLIFSISNFLSEESGLLTVTVMGMIMANIRQLHIEEILDFKESLSILIISMLFIILSARIEYSGFTEMGFGGITVLLIIMFIARPLSVWVCALGSSLTTNEKHLISWIAPRGIVAAAVSSLFVLKLQSYDHTGEASILVPMVFTIIIGTVVIQSLTASKFANILGVADPNPNGVLISGGDNFAILLGNALKENGFDVVLASNSYDQTRQARMANLNTYYGNVVSEHADRHLNLVGIGRLLSLYSREEENMLATLRYRTEFGSDKVYRVKINHNSTDNRHRTNDQWQSDYLFNEETTFSNLLSLTSEGASIKTTTLREAYPWTQYQEENPEAIFLFAVTPQQKLHIFRTNHQFEPNNDWKIVALIPDSKEKAIKKAENRLQQENEENI